MDCKKMQKDAKKKGNSQWLFEIIHIIILQSTHQVDMKSVECSKHFFGYFNTLETQASSEKTTRGTDIQYALYHFVYIF